MHCAVLQTEFAQTVGDEIYESASSFEQACVPCSTKGHCRFCVQPEQRKNWVEDGMHLNGVSLVLLFFFQHSTCSNF